MSEHWKQLLPVDRYIVRTNGIIHDYDRKVLTLLYQPLIGSICYSLYMTLWSEVDIDRLSGEEKTHHMLMSMMQTTLKHIHHERRKLEGIGLLRTYVKETSSYRSYLYELQRPLTPKQFFEDSLLNIYLYNRTGKTQYNKLKQFFSIENYDAKEYTSVTATFNDVFVSLHPSELTSANNELNQFLAAGQNSSFIDTAEPEGIKVSDSDFDFDLLMAGLSDSLFPKRAMTEKTKELVEKLAFIYQMNPLDMKDLVLRAFDPTTDEVDEEMLKELTRSWYEFEYDEQLPALSERVMDPKDRQMDGVIPQTKEEELMKKLELVSPYQLLKEISQGAEPSVSDLKIVEEVMIKQKLNPGVVNVLIYYVMLRSDMKLSKNYVTKIASHWARKKITTVKEAMQLAKLEHQEYQEWALSKKQNTVKRRF